MKKAIVFIDGSNFYFRLKELTRNLENICLLNFQYRGFCKWLCKNFDIVEIRYYIGVIKEKEDIKSKELFKNQ